ncbi:NYN domain-containing protein [Patescibacteria group bacterium]|nr:NYN domain-containing protein [Patescibacteria group bacterium]MCG2693329.1 NYN domain-containing protein [Candidatus Parcubacteria bacterium]
MISKYVKGKVYVFIDAANLENSVKSLGWWVDYKKLYSYFHQETTLVGIRHYCPRFNDISQDKFFTVLKRAGICLITKPLKIITEADEFKGKSRKANFDVEIAAEAQELVDEYDTCVLFSGDSDFDFLVKFLRKKGKRVVIISSKHHIYRELIASCNKYIDLKKFRKFIERTEK